MPLGPIARTKMSNSKRDRSTNDWDVIVIGSGMGGMAIAPLFTRRVSGFLKNITIVSPIDLSTVAAPVSAILGISVRP